MVTTRIAIADLAGMLGTAAVEHIELDKLPLDAGGQLLKQLGVRGTDTELKEAVEGFKGHALALHLLGSLLRDVKKGDIRYWREVPPLEVSDEHGPHARGVMESYVTWFRREYGGTGRGIAAKLLAWFKPTTSGDPPEVAVLRILGLFDRPADGGAIQALRQPPSIPGLTDSIVEIDEGRWSAAVARAFAERVLWRRSTRLSPTHWTHTHRCGSISVSN